MEARLQDPVHLWPLGPAAVIGLKTRGRRAVARAGPTRPLHRAVLIQMSAHTSSTTKRAGFAFNPSDLLTIAAGGNVLC